MYCSLSYVHILCWPTPLSYFIYCDPYLLPVLFATFPPYPGNRSKNDLHISTLRAYLLLGDI